MASTIENTSTRPFQATLTKGLKREHLPYLARCLLHLDEVHSHQTHYDPVILSFAESYSNMIHWSSHIANGKEESLLSHNIVNCKDAYLRFVGFERTLHDCMTDLPSFEELWEELLHSFQHIDGAVDRGFVDACSMRLVKGKTLEGYQAFAFEYMQHCDAAWTQVIASIFEKQPVYVDLPSNYDEYVSNRLAGRDCFFEMTAAVRRFSYDSVSEWEADDCVRAVFNFFAMSAAYVADLFMATSYTPTPAQVNVLIDACACEWSVSIDDFMCGGPIQVRQHMAGVNARGVAEALVHRCQQLLQQHPSHHLSWFLNTWLLAHAVSAFEGVPTMTRWIQLVVREAFAADEDLVNKPLEPKVDYIVPGFTHFRLSRRRLEAANLIATMEDVRFVPAGAALDPLDHTDMIQVSNKEDTCCVCQCEYGEEAAVKLRACGHVMHLECVRDMINRIEISSNRCPLDRKQICQRRPRQPVL